MKHLQKFLSNQPEPTFGAMHFNDLQKTTHSTALHCTCVFGLLVFPVIFKARLYDESCWGLLQLIDSLTQWLWSFVFLSLNPSIINLLFFVEKPLHSCFHHVWSAVTVRTYSMPRQAKKSKNHLSPHCGACAGESALLTPVSITCLSGGSCIRGC